MTEKNLPPDLQLFTVAEIADIQDISERQVRRQIARGELAHHRIGTAIRVSRADLESFLAQRRQAQENTKKKGRLVQHAGRRSDNY